MIGSFVTIVISNFWKLDKLFESELFITCYIVVQNSGIVYIQGINQIDDWQLCNNRNVDFSGNSEILPTTHLCTLAKKSSVWIFAEVKTQLATSCVKFSWSLCFTSSSSQFHITSSLVQNKQIFRSSCLQLMTHTLKSLLGSIKSLLCNLPPPPKSSSSSSSFATAELDIKSGKPTVYNILKIS